MMNKKNIARQLPIPVEDSEVEKSAEVIRVWVADGELYFSLFPIWKDNPEIWGCLLADTARHVARSLGDSVSENEERIFQQIKQKIMYELEKSTAAHSGQVLAPGIPISDLEPEL
jgi:hypothetical protein